MTSILLSSNVERANEFISELEKYASTLKQTKRAMEGIGLKNVSRDMLKKAIGGDFSLFMESCALLIEADLQGITNPTLRAIPIAEFNKRVESVKSKIEAISETTIIGFKVTDPQIEQHIDWDKNSLPFVSEKSKAAIYQDFSTFIRKSREKLYKKHHQTSDALNSFLQELYKSKMTSGVGIAPMLYLFNFFTIKEEAGKFIIEPKPIDYNYSSSDAGETEEIEDEVE
jgi:hypothetical protein